MADIDWKPRGFGHPRGLCGGGKPIPSSVYGRWPANPGDQLKTGERDKLKRHRSGTTDFFEAAKAAAALFEAGT
jgi:hypothetical protein